MNPDRVATGLLAGVFATMTALAFSYPPEASFLPRLIGSVATAIAVVRLVITWRSGPTGPIRVERQDGIAVLWFGAALISFGLIGVEFGAPLFIVAFLTFGAKVRFVWAAAWALGFAASVHLVFDQLLQVPLFPGLLFA